MGDKKRKKVAKVDFSDKVNHPAHYNRGRIECIEFIEDQGHGKSFVVGNALKYLVRAGAKGDEVEDLEKVIWYVRRRIEQVKAEREGRAAVAPSDMPQARA